MYTAEIKEKKLESGMLTVTTEFTDGLDIVTKTYQTNQIQSSDWLESLIKRDLDALNELPASLDSIVIGEFTDTVKPVNTLREEYERNLTKFQKYLEVVRLGFATTDRTEFVALKKWLTDNFKDEYLDLF